MKHELTLSVDEATKKTMEQINDDVCKSINEALQSNNALQTIDKLAKTFSELSEITAENQKTVIKKILSLETRINDISLIIENQKNNSERLDKIIEKLDYISLPFFKKMTKKRQNDGEIQTISDKEEK